MKLTILDRANNTPIPKASVSAFDNNNKRIGVIADGNGVATIPDNYFYTGFNNAVVSSVGYIPESIGTPTANQNVYLDRDEIELGGVIIESIRRNKQNVWLVLVILSVIIYFSTK